MIYTSILLRAKNSVTQGFVFFYLESEFLDEEVVLGVLNESHGCSL
jgi:hypothetical protein